MYCTPGDGQTHYTDPTCGSGVSFVVPGPTPAPDVFLETETALSSRIAAARSRGSQISVPAYYTRGPTSCEGPFVPVGDIELYELTEAIPRNQLEHFTITLPQGPGRIQRRTAETADGYRVPWTLHDRDLAVQCGLSIFDFRETAIPCAPTGTHYQQNPYYLDALCSSPVTSLGARAPDYVQVDRDGCFGTGDSFHRPGALLDMPSVFHVSQGSCGAAGVLGFSVHALGPPIALDSAIRVIANTGRRIEPLHFEVGGHEVERALLFDRTHEIECHPEQLDDGTVQCRAHMGSTVGYYTDGGCSSPIDLIEPKCGRAVPSLTRSPSGTLHEAGTQYLGPLFSQGPTSCVAANNASPVYSLGPIAPYVMPTGQFVIDP